jgi:hypothetical protein
MITDLVPYTALTAGEKAELHAWFDAHGVRHQLVPVKPKIRINKSGFHVQVYKLNERGRKFTGENGEPAMEWVTFQPTSPMPWRSAGRSEENA